MTTHSEITISVDPVAASAVPHVEQWCGPWAILPEHLQMMSELIRGMDLRSHLDQVAKDPAAIFGDVGGGDRYGYATRVVDDFAIVSVSGALMKHQASMSSNASTVMLRRTIRRAAHDPTIKGIMLQIDSPGGTVAGTREFANEISSANKLKPTHAFIEDLGASAAYWVASQAGRIAANATALVGSIGTYAVVEDYSKLAEEKGIKVHVVKAGEFKGSGVPGTEVTTEQLANMQRVIDGLNDRFLDGVVAGRNLSRSTVKSLNDGRVHLAESAQDLKLIDSVESFADAIDHLRTVTKSSRSVGMTKATETTTETVADDQVTDQPKATEPTKSDPKTDQRSELKHFMGAFGDTAGAKYFADGLSYSDALEAHIVALGEQIESANARADALQAKLDSLDLGETEAIDTGATPKGEDQAGTGWNSFFKQKA